MVECGVVENNADAALLCQLQQDVDHIRLVQIVCENIDQEVLIGQHFVEHGKDLLARREAEPFVGLPIGKLFSLRILAYDLRRIELQPSAVRLDL